MKQEQEIKEKIKQIMDDMEYEMDFYKKEIKYIEGRYGEYRTDYIEIQVLANNIELLESYYERLKELVK